jgi:hypothetical protein
VKLNAAETAKPDQKRAAVYRELQALQDETSKALRGVFTRHRRMLLA